MLNPIREEKIRYNAAHATTRNTIERAFGLLKRRLAMLDNPMRVKLRISKIIIMACALLHNIAVSQRYPLFDEHEREEKTLPVGSEDKDDVHVPADGYIDDVQGDEHLPDGQHYKQRYIQGWFARNQGPVHTAR